MSCNRLAPRARQALASLDSGGQVRPTTAPLSAADAHRVDTAWRTMVEQAGAADGPPEMIDRPLLAAARIQAAIYRQHVRPALAEPKPAPRRLDPAAKAILGSFAVAVIAMTLTRQHEAPRDDGFLSFSSHPPTRWLDSGAHDGQIMAPASAQPQKDAVGVGVMAQGAPRLVADGALTVAAAPNPAASGSAQENPHRGRDTSISRERRERPDPTQALPGVGPPAHSAAASIRSNPGPATRADQHGSTAAVAGHRPESSGSSARAPDTAAACIESLRMVGMSAEQREQLGQLCHQRFPQAIWPADLSGLPEQARRRGPLSEPTQELSKR